MFRSLWSTVCPVPQETERGVADDRVRHSAVFRMQGWGSSYHIRPDQCALSRHSCHSSLAQEDPARVVCPFRSVEKIEEFVESVDTEYMAHVRRLEEERVVRAAEAERIERDRRTAVAAARREAKKQRVDPSNANWPPPPIPGNASIVPVASYAILCEEGREQNNCVAVKTDGQYHQRTLF